MGHPAWDDFARVITAYREWKNGDRDKALDLASRGGVMTQALNCYLARQTSTLAAAR